MRTDPDAQAMQAALEALEAFLSDDLRHIDAGKAIAALQSRLSAPVGDAVAWGVPNTRPTERQPFMQLLHSPEGCQYPELLVPLYTHPAPDAVRRETVEACARIAEQWGKQKVDKWCKEDGDEGMCQVAKVSAWDALQVAAAIRAMLKGE